MSEDQNLKDPELKTAPESKGDVAPEELDPKDWPIYVFDTNVIIDYVDVIPGEEEIQLSEPTVNLDYSHSVIPERVIFDLSKFKKEESDRGIASRTALKRIDRISHGTNCSMNEIYSLQAPIRYGKRLISILPVHKDFAECLPFDPALDDNHGQIILAAIAASMAARGKPVNGHELSSGTYKALSFDNVTLLTNSRDLAIRARACGLKTMRYGYKYPPPYTGRREVVVPPELFSDFINDPSGFGVSRELFEKLMPEEPKLVANEFVVMRTADPKNLPINYRPSEDPNFRYVGRYDLAEDAIVHLRYATSFPTGVRNVGQAIYAEALLMPEIAAVICTGPAGSGKTYMSTVYGYTACLTGEFLGVTVVPCENRSNIGALPGDLNAKMDPDVQPHKNALRNYLLNEDSSYRNDLVRLQKYGPNKTESKKKGKKNNGNGSSGGIENQNQNHDLSNSQNGKSGKKRPIKKRLAEHVNLIWEDWFSNIPIEVARGRDFSYEFAIYDEFQDQNATQADTLIKRIGKNGKIVITGDVEQIHSPYLDKDDNGLKYASRLLSGNAKVAQVHFTEDEVVRHILVQDIAQSQRARHEQPKE